MCYGQIVELALRSGNAHAAAISFVLEAIAHSMVFADAMVTLPGA